MKYKYNNAFIKFTSQWVNALIIQIDMTCCKCLINQFEHAIFEWQHHFNNLRVKKDIHMLYLVHINKYSPINMKSRLQHILHIFIHMQKSRVHEDNFPLYTLWHDKFDGSDVETARLSSSFTIKSLFANSIPCHIDAGAAAICAYLHKIQVHVHILCNIHICLTI